jgi:hypothetical protein
MRITVVINCMNENVGSIADRLWEFVFHRFISEA